MDSHIRRRLREVAQQTLTGLETTEDRVYVGRARALGADHDPVLLIYTRNETSEFHATGRKLIRTVELMIEGRVVSATEPDDLLDTIAAEVEVAMANKHQFGGLALSSLLVATRQSIIADGANHIGEIVLEYQVQYLTFASDPSIAG